jgi:DNA-damage-inducible protein D
LKARLDEEGFELYDKIVQLKLASADGKFYETDYFNTESMFRIIQSIPSPKAEPFKRWLAKVGYERVQEIEDPELAQKRMKEIYKMKGYSDEWIEKRVRGMTIRDELTDEWDKRGVKSRQDFSILTAEISRATFGLTPTEYKRLKGLKTENLRDHMDDIELILTMLGEATTTRFTRDRDSQEFPELRNDAKEGGDEEKHHIKIMSSCAPHPCSSVSPFLISLTRASLAHTRQDRRHQRCFERNPEAVLPGTSLSLKY